MFNKSEQLEILSKIRIRDGDSKRMDCPFCGGKYTFTLTRRDGSLIWNCYKASCGVRGATQSDRSLDSIKARLANLKRDVHNSRIPLPGLTSSIDHHPEAVCYLDRVHSLHAYRKGLADIRYYPKEHRVLFYMNNGAGCVGRSLYSDAKPKWKAFGDTTGIFTCGTGKTGIVVEDAASACAVSVLADVTGIALLGTNVSPLQKVQLLNYDKLIISLDKDASKKAIMLLRKLEAFVPTTVRFLEEDAKWLSEEELRGIFHESERNSHH